MTASIQKTVTRNSLLMKAMRLITLPASCILLCLSPLLAQEDSPTAPPSPRDSLLPDNAVLRMGGEGQTRRDALETVAELLELDLRLPAEPALEESTLSDPLNISTSDMQLPEILESVLAGTSYTFYVSPDQSVRVFPISQTQEALEEAPDGAVFGPSADPGKMGTMPAEAETAAPQPAPREGMETTAAPERQRRPILGPNEREEAGGESPATDPTRMDQAIEVTGNRLIEEDTEATEPGLDGEVQMDFSVPQNVRELETDESVVMEFPQIEQEVSPTTQLSDQELISVDFPNEEIRTILRNVADLYDLNLVIPDTLTGSTSVKLRNVTWRQVFDVVLDQIGFTYVEERNIIKVKSKEELAAEPTTTRVFVIDYANASELQSSLSLLVDSAAGGRIQVDQRANALLITEQPSKMNSIQEVIERLDQPTEQVMIESRFIEVSNRDVENLGINWTSLSGYGLTAGPFSSSLNRITDDLNTTGRTRNNVDADSINEGLEQASDIRGVDGDLEFPSEFQTVQVGTGPDGEPIERVIETFPSIEVGNTNENLRSINWITDQTAVFNADAFNVILSALKSQDDVKLVSNPTVVTLNNTEALISIGERFPIPQYRYNDERGTFEVSGFDYEDIGINLSVTPQVNSAGFINLQILPEVSSRSGTVNFGGAAGAEIPIIASRRTESVITIKDGFTLAIGGLIEEDTQNGNTKVPVLGDVPVLGKAFRSKSVSTSSRNLLIFITAKTLDPDGSTYEDIVDPRVLRDMNISERDLPGFRLSSEERDALRTLREARERVREQDAITRYDEERRALEAAERARMMEAGEPVDGQPWYEQQPANSDGTPTEDAEEAPRERESRFEALSR